jgi:uncharacterized C2H2 Zn-finger protein
MSHSTVTLQSYRHKAGITKFINIISSIISYMENRDREILRERSATCKKCGLTARNQFELDDHINHAHKGDNRAPESGFKKYERNYEPHP